MACEIAHTPRKVHETNWREHSRIVNLELFVRTSGIDRLVLSRVTDEQYPILRIEVCQEGMHLSASRSSFERLSFRAA